MPDFNPAVLRRMLFLRQCDMFATADLDELATMAENVVSTTHPAGSIIEPAGAYLSALRFVVEGRIEARDRHWGPRQVFGALEVAAARPLATPAIATTTTETFELSNTDFGEVLEDNFGVLLSALRDLATQVLALDPSTIRRLRPMPVLRNLGLVERLLLLRQLVPFLGARMQALVRLAHDSEEVRLPAGVILPGDELASGGLVIVEGTVHTSEPGAHVLGPGDSLGYLEALSGRPVAKTWTSTTGLRALRTPTGVLFDVLEDHTDVGLALVSAFSRALLDRADKRTN